jgi:hypothetical protein
MATIAGIAILSIGVILLFLGISKFTSGFGDPVGGFSGASTGFLFFAAGGFMMVFGLALVYMANLRQMYSYVSQGVTEGVRRGGGLQLDISGLDAETRGRSGQTIKIKCRSCGALNDEDDDYCGKCGRRL